MPNKTIKSLALLPILALVCFTALSVFAADPCKTSKLKVPDPATLNLKDGEHVIAAVETPNGKFEARVNVKGKVVSEPQFLIGGKALSKTPESQVPADLRECVKSAQQAQNAASPSGSWLGNVASPSGSWLGNATRPSFGFIAPVAYAKDTFICVATASCSKAVNGKYYCVAYACCSSGATTTCAFHSGLY
jgi:hypothetical protein